ncbi:ricin-type beta-trefoil lectin domain protein [Micromonospora sp. HUAS LYJ1]|uniref:RICIN domain-containing protein n=1 Tax=Micromonospora sp. HUAS LYJ1 TaxID=3061626 RepID=UPI0026739D0E|nr:ricin-type beta-trefoil lectin domain protein [Micromonospora sp. HUAS LYJ1]WKU05353.1 ricin-type beta-trefoil lectin domain protein [Micromonospora sp. HUAS LYJ1]
MTLAPRAKNSHHWSRRVALAAMAVVASAGMVITDPGPASAAGPVGGGLLVDRATGRCLDSNENGSVYTSRCDFGNGYLHWSVYTSPFGQYNLRSDATGRCLDGNTAGVVYTSPCDGNNNYQNWAAGFGGNPTLIFGMQTSRCLDSNEVGHVYTSACDVNNPYELWAFAI